MNRIALIAAVAALILPAAASGADKPAADKAAAQKKDDGPMETETPKKRVERKPASGPLPKAEAESFKVATKDPVKRGPSRAREDARACLEQATNREVAICAEKFR